MDEEKVVEEMDAEDEFDGFDDDFSDVDISDVEDDAEETTDAEEESETEGEEQAQEARTPEAETFELKYNKETKSYTRDEVKTLAQKGLNYDHVMQQRDSYQKQLEEARQYRSSHEETVDMLEAAAKAAGMDVPQFLSTLRENTLVAGGMSRDAAKERLAREDAERKLAKASAADSKTNNEKQRQKADAEAFMSSYPDVKAETIPEEVWDAVRKGESLVSAYGRYDSKRLADENKKLREQLAAHEQNEINKKKTLGSMKSSAKAEKKDPFDEGFDSDAE